MSVGKINRPGLPFSNVAANSVATANITPGKTIEAITLVMGGTAFTSAHISDLKLRANGKVIVHATGSQLEKLAEFRGDTVTTHLPIYFSDFRGLDALDQDVGGFDTSIGIENLTMEVTIGAATAPTLRYQIQESASQAGRAVSPILSKILRYPYNVSTGGDLLIALPFGNVNGAAIKRLHVEYAGADGNVSKVVCKQDSNVIHEAYAADVTEYNSRFGLVPQSKMYSIDFVANGGLKNAWDTKDARSVELLVTFAALDSGHVIVEYLDTLGNL